MGAPMKKITNLAWLLPRTKKIMKRVAIAFGRSFLGTDETPAKKITHEY